MGLLGRIIRKKSYEYIGGYSNGYARAILKMDERSKSRYCGIVVIDKDYYIKMETDMQYINMGKICWHNDYIYASVLNKGTQCFADRNLNKVKMNHEYLDIYSLGEYFVVTEKKTRQTGLLDKNLNTAVDCDYEEVESIGKGEFFSCYNLKGETLIYCVKTGKKKLVPGKVSYCVKYNGKWYFRFELDDRYGYYDENFEVYIQPIYTRLSKIGNTGIVSYYENDKIEVLQIDKL